jgi:hypothetical protein
MDLKGMEKKLKTSQKVVIPAEAGIQNRQTNLKDWIPVSTGITGELSFILFTKLSRVSF